MRGSDHPFTLGPGRPACARVACAFLLLALAALAATGCDSSAKPEQAKASPPPPRWPTLPPKTNVPEFMKGTIWEIADLANKDPYPVSGYGLVTGLDKTGNNNGIPPAVRNHMIDEMVRRGMGSKNENLQKFRPESVLDDPRAAIVEVYGLLPPGTRAGQRVDVFVQACTGSATSSLARGNLYLTDLYRDGIDPIHPGGRINPYMKAKGAVFVNPAYADTPTSPLAQSSARATLRTGVILGGGICTSDRELWVRIRQPQLSMARAIEWRILQRFHEPGVAKAEDEGMVFIYVPHAFNGDWEHFVGVATHLYLNPSPGFGALRAQQLAADAVRPGALLQDISYCWEGIGEDAIPFLQPLYLNPSPEVAFAAARAGAFIGDGNAELALLDIAKTDKHPFQLNAVKILGALPPSVRNDRMLTELLSVDNALVRIEAYQILADHQAPAVVSRTIGDSFILDRVFSSPTAPPLIYATRSGVPRIALFGQHLPVKTPMMLSTMGDRLTISSSPDGQSLIAFDRTDDEKPHGTEARLSPDLVELVYRLGNGRDEGFHLVYGDLVSILKQMSDRKEIAASFVLQDLPQVQDAIADAPPIIEPTAQPQRPVEEKIPTPELGLKNYTPDKSDPDLEK